MSIKKIIKVKNIGRLENLAAVGDVEFRRLTLIHGLNGNGKTTLASIFRSLKNDDPAFISERSSLGATEPPEAAILLDEGLVTFSDGRWDRTFGDIEIFDSVFISDNVYTGDYIEQDNRKNLYQVVVGESAVQLRKKFDDIDSKNRDVASRHTKLENELKAQIQTPFDLNEFLELAPEENLVEKISNVTSELNAVRKNREIISRNQLETFRLPNAPLNVTSVLCQTVEHLVEESTRKVEEHFQSVLGLGGEQWIRQGLNFKHDSSCPFCAQNIQGNELIRAFEKYFSTTYKDHIVSIQRAVNEININFSEEALSSIVRRMLENDAKISSWADLANLNYAQCSPDRLVGTWKNLRLILSVRLQKKLEQPVAVFSEDDAELSAAIKDYQEAVALILAHNAEIEKANGTITELKKKAASTDESELESKLRRLRNMQIRGQADVARLCSEITNLREEKIRLEAEKDVAREELKNQVESIFEIYEGAINGLLKKFGATFELTGIKPSFAGGKASSTFQIAINKIPLDIGNSKTPKGTPCFRTALSAGDKSTLALAFFIARLEQDSSLDKKIVVFDDPLSSLDCFRISSTQQEIRHLAKKAQQVIVFSHDENFIKRIYDEADSLVRKPLHMVRKGTGYSLDVWDIQQYFKEFYHREYFILRQYLDQGFTPGCDRCTVASCIRIILETELRHRHPKVFLDGEQLGQYIKIIGEANDISEVAYLKGKTIELSELNEFSRRFHHSGYSATTASTSDAELRPYVQRALNFRVPIE